MATCVMCGADLPTPLATYGDGDAPCCQSCWLTPVPDGWNIEIFACETLPDGTIVTRKGKDYHTFFDLPEPQQEPPCS